MLRIAPFHQTAGWGRRAALAFIVGLLTACAGPPPPAERPRPRLVVFFVVDGLPMRQLLDNRALFGADGFARFFDRGTWFADAHQAHAYTVTAAGHASMLSGAYPQRSGIIGNEWRDVTTGEPQYNTGDTRHRTIGHPTRPLDGTSPRNLRVETLGDVLRGRDPRSKVIAISGKDRGAILTGGHKGTAYMYMDETGQFASSTYYMAQHPAWAEAFNNTQPADRYFKTSWLPARDDAAYVQALTGAQPWAGARAGRLPMVMGASEPAPSADFYANLRRSPFIDVLSLDFARAALAGEQLGQDDAPDILSISLSGHDYVNHAWSAESRLSIDHLLHLDQMLAAFFADLDRSVGRDRYLAVLTADHGFMPVPEVSRLRGLDAERVPRDAVLGRVNALLRAQFGVDKLVRFSAASNLVLDRRLLAEQQLALDTVAEAARNALMQERGVAAAYTRAEMLAQSRVGAPFFESMSRAWHAELSGDVPYVLKPFWMMSSSGASATHGSPHPYDTNVPILFWGPAWVGAGRVDAPAAVVDIAPTLARVLKVPAPAATQGQPLPLAH